MRATLLKFIDRIRGSFWFVPTWMVLAAVALAGIAVYADQRVADEHWQLPAFAFAGSPDGATAVLSTIAGSMITIAGVVFSLTLVALSLASSQFGPRLLRNFMRDRSNQVVLGTFVATFLYCLLVLRAVQHVDGETFVPHLSINLAVALALVSIGVLIYFIHHISLSIQADEIIARVVVELDQGIPRLFPEQIGEDDPGTADDRPPPAEPDAAQVDAPCDGYLQIVDAEALVEAARDAGVVLHLAGRPGDFLARGSALARVVPAGRLDEDLAACVRAAFVLGDQRTAAQDVSFSLQQLAEIAVRALSPGINDPYTAMTCIDRLGAAFCQLAARRFPSARRADDDGELRVVAPGHTFCSLLEPVFDAIRRHARGDIAVSERMLEAIERIAPRLRRDEDRRLLLQHADLVAHSARAAADNDHDAMRITTWHRRVLCALAA